MAKLDTQLLALVSDDLKRRVDAYALWLGGSTGMCIRGVLEWACDRHEHRVCNECGKPASTHASVNAFLACGV